MTHDDFQAHLDAEDAILVRLAVWLLSLGAAIVAGWFLYELLAFSWWWNVEGGWYL